MAVGKKKKTVVSGKQEMPVKKAPPNPAPEIPGDCRLCLHFIVPNTTGKATDRVTQTASYTVRPCNIGVCKGKKFEPRVKEAPEKESGDEEK